MIRRSFLSLTCACLLLGSVHAEVRTWTWQDGRQFSGEYISSEEGKVCVLVNGRERNITVSMLGQADQQYVREKQQMQQAPGSAHENNNFNSRWPSSSVMEDKLRAKMIEENEGSYIYETTHFRFLSPEKLSLSTVSEMGRIFEGAYSANMLIPLNAPCRRYEGNLDDKLVARLFATKESYAEAVGPEHAESAGLFNGEAVMVPFESLGFVKKGAVYAKAPGARIDSHTLVHELTHQMTIYGANYRLPIWFAEGIAEYMGITPYKNGKLAFTGTKKALASYVIGGPGTNARQLGTHFTSPPLRTFLEQSVEEFQSAMGDTIQFNYGMSLVMFYYFAHIDGKGDAARLKRWMRALQAGECKPTDYARLLDGRTWNELEKDVAKGVKSKLGMTITFEGE